jgi:hypothetical protein
MLSAECEFYEKTDSVALNEDDFYEEPDGVKEYDLLTRLRSAPFVDVSNCFPAWLPAKTGEIETMHEKDFKIVKVRIFRGEWNNRFVYFISDSFSSCLFCEVYYEEGERIEWPAGDPGLSHNFESTSKNWILIYEFGEGLF